jgi:diguanylate cyclase (GGDEF)-like protein/PAS domain S-box-containing protein
MSNFSDLEVERLFKELDRRTQVEIFTRNPDPLVIVEHETFRVLAANDSAVELFGWRPTAVVSKALDDLTVSEDTIRLYAELSGSDESVVENNVFRYRHEDGRTVFLEFRYCRIEYEGSDAFLVSVTDVSENRLLRSRLSRLLDASPDLVCTLDRSYRFVDVSAAAQRVLGFEPHELTRATVYKLVHPVDRRRMLMEADRLFEGGDPTTAFECRCLHKSGDFRWLLWSFAYSPFDDVIHCVGRDITDRKNLEEQLAKSALHDPATGLANRALTIDRLQAAAIMYRQTGALFAVLLIRIERLEFLYCALGKEAADNAMTSIVERISNVVDGHGTVGRVSGDRFAVLLSGASETVATGTAMRLRQVLTDPIEIEGEGISVTVTIGVVSAGPDLTVNGESLLESASVAADMARSTGQNIETFDVAYRKSLRERIKLESELRRAVVHGEFHMLYHPVVNIKDGEVVAFEALLRWDHPRRGVISPTEFIQVAEEAGVIVPIGSWVMRAVASQIAAWRQLTGKEVKVAVNVAMQQLVDGSFVEIVKDCIAANIIQGQSLMVELTERAYMIGDDRTHEAVLALRLMHCELAMDDFGTGYSSLSCLKHLPVNVIKIDKSFVDGVTHDHTDRALIDGIITFAHALRLKVIAEGVETLEQLRALDALGCDMAQGYLIAQPMSPEEVRTWHLEVTTTKTLV